MCDGTQAFFFRRITVPRIVFSFSFYCSSGLRHNGVERDAALVDWCIMCCFDKDLSVSLVS